MRRLWDFPFPKFILRIFKNFDRIGFELLEVDICNLCRSNQYLDNIKIGRAVFSLKILQIRIFSLVGLTFLDILLHILSWKCHEIWDFNIDRLRFNQKVSECSVLKGCHWIDNWKQFYKNYLWGKKLLKWSKKLVKSDWSKTNHKVDLYGQNKRK